MRAFVFGPDSFQIDTAGTAPVPDGAKIVDIPDGVPFERLVWNGKKLVDRDTVTTWYVDPQGNSRAFQGDPSWVSYNGKYNAPRVRAANGAVRIADDADVLAGEINAYARATIYAKVSDNAQKNITAYSTSLVKDVVVRGRTLSDAEKADLETAQAIFDWISGPNGVTTTARDLVAAQNKNYRTSGSWPRWNVEWDAFVARF